MVLTLYRFQIQGEMDFYAVEGKAIEADEEDNRVVERLVKEYEDGKRLYAEARGEIQRLNEEVAKLKAVVKEYQESNKKLQAEVKTRSHLYAKQQPLFFKDPTNGIAFSHSASDYFNVQQTKRKVINGFVAELTYELQNSQELLLKERKMHEEMRRNLQLANEENQGLRMKNRALQNQMSAIMLENRQLFSQLSQMQTKKQALDSELQHILTQLNRQKSYSLRRESQSQSQFILMDQIYRQIQLQLQT